MQESQFYSLGQVCLAGKRLCFDRLQCVDAWMINVGLVEFSETLFMTYWLMSISKTCWAVPPHCHHEKLSSGNPWLPYTIQSTLGYNISFTWSGRCYKHSESWDSPVCIWSLLSDWQVLKAGYNHHIILSLFFTSSIVQVLPLWLSKTANLFFWSCHLRTVLALAWIRSLGCFRLKFNAIVSSVHIFMSSTFSPWLWVIP